MSSLVTPEALAVVGVKRPLRRGVITADGIARYCAAVDDRDPVYRDPTAARAAGYPDIIAPPLYPAAPTRPAPFHEDLLADGQLGDLAPPGLGNLQSLLGGQDWELVRPARVGETVIDEVQIGAIEERQGRNGPMVFVREDSIISGENGEIITRGYNHLIFREAPPPPPPLAEEVEEQQGERVPITSWEGDELVKRPDIVSLFMFDAVIWATHRLHWDAGQARREGLRAPILPGWMMSSYLAEFAQSHAGTGRRLASLSLRFTGFGHPGDVMRCASTGGDVASGLDVALTNGGGTTLMKGKATFGLI